MNKIFPPRSWVRALYECKGTGLPRIAEFIRKMHAKWHPNTEVIIDDFGKGRDLRFACRLGEHMGSQIYWRGTYSGSQLQVLALFLPPGGVFIDLGANQGEFTIFAAGLVGKEGHVFAFEPSPIIRKQLLKNIQLNGFEQVSIEPFAVADKPGRLSLYSPIGTFDDGTIHDGLSTLYPKARAAASTATEVEVTTLDAWLWERNLDRVDVIKMDIEGAELPALQGSLGLIQRFRPVVIIELNAATYRAAGYTMQDLIAWLWAQNYDIFKIEENAGLSHLNPDRLAAFQNVLARPRV
ncbi:FkbM family methyltransferase [Thermosynechococcus sp. TA-1]|uniref:FkbM family methyltransferase n=1 Tax=Thermosynechococcus sp. TA-1 TaxID=2813673 RepID=UPI00197D27A8|nr:FkbM family methyltransferase [Thermosynechococcus sp. TA-1]QSF49915.1 FkbM family methyltransferase [Thermosynechococcus sp. TA-1]